MAWLFNKNLPARDGDVYVLTELSKEHLDPSSPWGIASYFGSVKERSVCLDMVQVLRTGNAMP